MTKVTAQLNNLRISPRKVRLVADRVRGVQVSEAIGLMKYDLRKTAEPLEKLLKSAVANAENNFKLNEKDLYISDIIVGEGPTLKRWRPRAYGRAAKILKRTSRVSIVLTDGTDKVEKKEVKKSNSQKDTK
ncbi:MAG: 50S ribosomal protein L22 [Candidatus Moraniibacteriota bacterium]|jgi:large subunit ribosomal protein L22